MERRISIQNMKSSYKKELIKTFIKNVGIDVILQSIIETMDDTIDASDYDIDSLRNPNDLWKFKVIEGLEHAYEAYLQKTDEETIEEQS